MYLLRRTPLLVLALTVAISAPVRAADEEKFLPDDAQAIFTFNIRQFLESELIKKLGLDDALTKNQEAQKTLSELGLNPLKDLERVIVAPTPQDDQTLLIIQGKFDATKLATKADVYAKEHKDTFKIHKSDGGTIYELKDLDNLVPLPPQAQNQVNLKGKSVFLAVADGTTLVGSGSREAVTTAMAKATGKKKTTLQSKDLGGLLSKMDGKSTMAIAVPGSMVGTEKVKHVLGGITVAGDVKIDARVAASDLDAAKEVSEQIKEALQTAQGLVGAFAAQQKALMPVVEILNGIKHEVKDKEVVLTTTIKAQTLEDLFKGLAALGAGGF